MRTVFKGKNIEVRYKAVIKTKDIGDSKNKKKIVYTDVPRLDKDVKQVGWNDMFTVEGEPYAKAISEGRVYISEDKDARVIKTNYRADLNEIHVFLDVEDNKVELHKSSESEIVDYHKKKFNVMMINSNEKLKAYCDIHKLNYEETDVITLFNIVFPNSTYRIVDGKIVCNPTSTVSYAYANASTSHSHTNAVQLTSATTLSSYYECNAVSSTSSTTSCIKW